MVTQSDDDYFSDLDWLQDVENVMASLSHYKAPSRKLYIVPVIVLLKGNKDGELLMKYSEELEKCVKEISDNENLAQSKTDRELKNWITFNDVRDKIKQLQRTIKKKIVVKNVEDITVEDRKLITHHAILNLYSRICPLRNDFAHVKIIPYGREQTEAEKGTNVLVEESPGCYTLLLRQIFANENRRVGSWMLRKIFLSELYKDDTTLQKRKAVAASMGHSAEIAERVYRRV
ncbi:hypothetical protein KFL_008240010 [Klebsormidium nitens]|uniref:Uncharacterized protein n=1 Tax=Klebsormidium nitens TaxID=105231 RepID=A0A1Y1IL97_KLENI|nr:hypothetical protein KFL_008240010 [Klebsormidium nitens]|eukprot:GAQ91640.1 hypothetical protein KFL_008240010 [Klebsormidium nitens]